MKYSFLLLILLNLFFGCKPTEQAQETVDHEFISYLFQDYKGENPGASCIVIKNGKIVFEEGYGYADLENKQLVTPTTNFRIASVTKQFTALGIMLLVHQGKLSYDTRLTEIFPDFPDYGKEVSVQHLLSHQSGLVRYNRFIKPEQTEQLLDKDVLNGLFTTDSTYFEPGSRYAYSNTGFAVLAQIIEKISGLSFAQFMEKEIFAPLKIEHSTIYEAGKEIKERAYGYVVRDSANIKKDQNLTSAIQGDGGVYSSVSDYFNWDQALYNNQLLPQEELQLAFKNWTKPDEPLSNGYGFGWNVGYANGLKVLQHGGSSIGFGSHVIRIPELELSVVIFSNRNKRGKEIENRAKALVHLFSEGKYPMPLEIMVEKAIDQQGIEKGISTYQELKADSVKYSFSKSAFLSFGLNYINNKEYDVALPLFEQLIYDYPTYFGGYYGAAVTYHKQTKAVKAIELYQKTIQYSKPQEKWAADYAKKMIGELQD